MELDFEDTCEFVTFRIGKMVKRFLHDHARGFYRLAQVLKEKTDDPIVADPFIIPTKELVDFKDTLRYRTLVGNSNTNESQIERMLGLRIVMQNLQRRSLDELFARNYDGVEDYLVKPI